eukprot:s510_g23.t1
MKENTEQDASEKGEKDPETLPPPADEATATPRRGVDTPAQTNPAEQELVTPVQKPSMKRSKQSDFSGEKKTVKKRKSESAEKCEEKREVEPEEKPEETEEKPQKVTKGRTEENNFKIVQALAADKQSTFRFPMKDVGSAAKLLPQLG